MISAGYKSAYQQGYSDAMRDFRKKSNTDVLDKIRTEVEKLPSELTADGRRMIRRGNVFRIIDKYKIESEGQESTTKNVPRDDVVSRNEVLNQIFYSTDNSGDVVLGSALRERIARLPSVTPQEPKTGPWIDNTYDKDFSQCSECESNWEKSIIENCNMVYCPNCGAKMQEVGE